MIDPMPEDVQDAKLYRLAVLLPVPLPIFALRILLHLIRVRIVLIINEGRIGDLKAFDEQLQKLAGRAKAPVGGQERTYEFRIGVDVIRQPFHEFVQRSSLIK